MAKYWSVYHPRRNKYGNQKRTFNGLTFASKKECDRYIELYYMQKSGAIKNLRMQVPFEIQPKFMHNGKTIRAIKYIADFVYEDADGIQHIEDTKGFRTDEYKLKKKLLLYRGIEIEEI